MALSTPITELKLIPIGAVDQDLLEYLTFALPESLGAQCKSVPAIAAPRNSYDSKRRQYNSTSMLSNLLELEDNLMGGAKILGVTDSDLFIPIFTFVFGEAQLGGAAALISTHRLRQQFYGLPGNNDLFYVRAEKEATHELGHTRGLVHCRSYDCVMHFSNSIEQVDMRSSAFCQACEALLRDETVDRVRKAKVKR